jgi:hypothetical protein
MYGRTQVSWWRKNLMCVKYKIMLETPAVKIAFGVITGLMVIFLVLMCLALSGVMSKTAEVIAPTATSPPMYALRWALGKPFDVDKWTWSASNMIQSSPALGAVMTVDDVRGDLVVNGAVGMRTMDINEDAMYPLIDLSSDKDIAIFFDTQSTRGMVKLEYSKSGELTTNALDINYSQEGVDILRKQPNKVIDTNSIIYERLALPDVVKTALKSGMVRYRIMLDRKNDTVRVDMASVLVDTATVDRKEPKSTSQYVSLLTDIPYKVPGVFNRLWLYQEAPGANYFNRLLIMPVPRNKVPYY